MADSLEYRTIFECFGSLVTAFKGDPVAIADELAAVSLIPPPQDVADQKKSDLARRLAEDIRDRVKLSPSRYEDVVRVLSKHKWLEDIVRILQNTNQKLKQKVDQQNTLTCDSSQDHGEKSLLSYHLPCCLTYTREEWNNASFSCDLGEIPHCESSLKVPNPVVSFASLDEDDLEDLQAQMSELTKEIKLQFDIFFGAIFKSFRDSTQIDRDKLVITLMDKESIFDKDEVDKTKTVYDVFRMIKSHCSYFNYDVLKTMIRVDGSDRDKTYLEEYNKAFTEYCKAMPCAEGVYGNESSKSRRTKLKFKLNYELEQLKPNDVLSIKNNIARCLEIRPSSLYLCRVKEGCVLLEFMVPDFIVDKIFHPSDSQILELYLEVKVLSVESRGFDLDIESVASQLLPAAKIQDNDDDLPVMFQVHPISRPTHMFLPVGLDQPTVKNAYLRHTSLHNTDSCPCNCPDCVCSVVGKVMNKLGTSPGIESTGDISPGSDSPGNQPGTLHNIGNCPFPGCCCSELGKLMDEYNDSAFAESVDSTQIDSGYSGSIYSRNLSMQSTADSPVKPQKFHIARQDSLEPDTQPLSIEDGTFGQHGKSFYHPSAYHGSHSCLQHHSEDSGKISTSLSCLQFMSTPTLQSHFISRKDLLTVELAVMHNKHCKIPGCCCYKVRDIIESRGHRQSQCDALEIGGARNDRIIQQQSSVDSDADYNSENNKRQRPMNLRLVSDEHDTEYPNQHPHYHLTSKSHLRRVNSPVPIHTRRCKSLTDLTPLTEVPETHTPTPTIGGIIKPGTPTYGSLNSLEGENGGREHPLLLREISISADNVPTLCLNDCPFTPSPLKEGRHPLAQSPNRLRRKGSSFQRGYLRSAWSNLKTVKEKTNSDDTDDSNTSSRADSPIKSPLSDDDGIVADVKVCSTSKAKSAPQEKLEPQEKTFVKTAQALSVVTDFSLQDSFSDVEVSEILKTAPQRDIQNTPSSHSPILNRRNDGTNLSYLSSNVISMTDPRMRRSTSPLSVASSAHSRRSNSPYKTEVVKQNGVITEITEC